MAAYCWDDLKSHLLADCTPGSAPGPTLGNEYGRTLPVMGSEMHFVKTVVCM